MNKFIEPKNIEELYECLTLYYPNGKKLDDNISNLTIKKIDNEIFLIEKQSNDENTYKSRIYYISSFCKDQSILNVLEFTQSDLSLFDVMKDIFDRRVELFKNFNLWELFSILINYAKSYKNESLYNTTSDISYPKSKLEVYNMLNIHIFDDERILIKRKLKKFTKRDIEFIFPGILEGKSKYKYV